MGWVRPTGEVHAKGASEAVQAFMAFLGDAASTERARVEGHEQFAIRGVSAGLFVVQEPRRGRPLKARKSGHSRHGAPLTIIGGQALPTGVVPNIRVRRRTS